MIDRPYKKIAGIFGLSDHQSKIYLAGLGTQGKTVSELSRSAELPRTAVYPPLQSLVQEGLVSVTRVNKHKIYLSTPIKELENLLDRKRVELHEVIDLLPKTVSLESARLDIRVYEGKNGLLTAGDIFLSESKTKLWKVFEHPQHTLSITGQTFLEAYTKRRIEKGIHGRCIIPADSLSTYIKETLLENKKQLREVVIVSPNTYPLEASIGIAGDIILLISTTPSPFSVLIKNAALATTLSSIHDMAWDRFSA
jgi:predicted transcriptional regulator